jgi:hypothetical protein
MYAMNMDASNARHYHPASEFTAPAPARTAALPGHLRRPTA